MRNLVRSMQGTGHDRRDCRGETMMHSVEHRFVAIVCGAMLVFVAPLIVLFLIFRNKIMAGVARGGTKG